MLCKARIIAPIIFIPGDMIIKGTNNIHVVIFIKVNRMD